MATKNKDAVKQTLWVGLTTIALLVLSAAIVIWAYYR